MTSNARTTIAFDRYRSSHAAPQSMHPDAARYTGDTDQISEPDGLLDWVDGPITTNRVPPADCPSLEASDADQRLWAVTLDRVVHASEYCPFGVGRGAGALKHSNLTGGGDAFVGGELRWISNDTIAITGNSGRYRPRDADDMRSIELAFLDSGYNVWSMGFSTDTNRPYQFGMIDPEWVTS